MKINSSNLIQVTERVVIWLVKAFKLELTLSLNTYRALIHQLGKVQKCRGDEAFIKYLKFTRLALQKYICGQPLVQSQDGVGLTSAGIPKVLGPWIHKLESSSSPLSHHDLAVLLTILNMSRALRAGKTVDTDPISASAKSRPVDIGKHVNSFWLELGFSKRPLKECPSSARFRRFHLSTKVGPSKLSKTNAMWHSISDLLALPPALYEAVGFVGGKLLREKMDLIKEAVLHIPELGNFLQVTPSDKIRRLSWFPDKELKVRVIAILDYMSQTALRPLHQFLFKVLRRIPQDMTFDQNAFTSLDISGVVYSIDLSSATDRFPIWAIERVLEGHFPYNYVKSWQSIMTGYPFECTLPDRKTVNLSYGVGQPMGAYSSWSSFALAHHYVVYYCAKELQIPWHSAKYAMLGDDIIIYHKELAESYMQFITNLGVEFSLQKTYISPHFFEFSKRLFWKGKEVSPFPISALSGILSQHHAVVSTLLELENKGWVPAVEPAEAASTLIASIRSLPSRYEKKIRLQAKFCDRVMRIIRGTVTAGEAITSLARDTGFQLDINDVVGLNLLENITVESFAKSNPLNAPKKGAALGDLAINLTMLLTGLDELRSELGFRAIYALPILQLYGQIEETYMDLTRKAFLISTSGGGNWPLIFKSMALPFSDGIFVERSNRTISRVSSHIGSSLIDRFKMLRAYPQLLNPYSTSAALHRKAAPIDSPLPIKKVGRSVDWWKVYYSFCLLVLLISVNADLVRTIYFDWLYQFIVFNYSFEWSLTEWINTLVNSKSIMEPDQVNELHENVYSPWSSWKVWLIAWSLTTTATILYGSIPEDGINTALEMIITGIDLVIRETYDTMIDTLKSIFR